MQELNNRHYLIGLTGGIACYKSAELLRRLQDQGATVEVVMTQAAKHFISETTFQALSGRPVYTDLWDKRPANAMAHINLSRQADALIIAPATADFIAKVAHGFADDLLSTLCLARGDCPLLIAPAMNREMWANPATQRNVSQLQADGVQFLGPGAGSQACGEFGDGRMLEPHELLAQIIAWHQPKVLQDQRVLITAGPTSEAIDPVRVISNRSSGKMGYAIAQAAYEAGAQVTLVSGPTALETPFGVERINVETAQQMYEVVLGSVANTTIFISVAAVADWRVANPASQKIKKSAEFSWADLEFVENPDILASVAKLKNSPYCVGFAAESDQLDDHATAKKQRKNLPLLVGNIAQETLGSDDARLVLFDDNGRHPFQRMPKLQAARQLIQAIAQRYHSTL